MPSRKSRALSKIQHAWTAHHNTPARHGTETCIQETVSARAGSARSSGDKSGIQMVWTRIEEKAIQRPLMERLLVRVRKGDQSRSGEKKGKRPTDEVMMQTNEGIASRSTRRSGGGP